jgi:hypothetical protein
MADKTGMEELIPILENLYLDYLAFRHIARTAEQEKWAIHLNDYRKANSTRIGQQFGAITDALRTAKPVYSAQFDAAVQQLADLLVEGMVGAL